MVKGKSLDPELVKAVHVASVGKSYTEVAKCFGRTKNWIYHIMKNFDGGTGLRIDAKIRGRKRKTTDAEDQALLKFVGERRFESLRELDASLKVDGPVQVSRTTMHRRLSEAGWTKVGVVRDDLTADHKRKRVEYAAEKLFLLEEWKKRPQSDLHKPSPFYQMLHSDEMFVRLKGGKITVSKSVEAIG